MQLERKPVELATGDLVASIQCVVAQHGWNGDGQAECGHDQRFTNRAGDLVNRWNA